MTIPLFDQVLTAKIEKFIHTFRDMKGDLYMRKTGCVCTDNSLCAHHAAIYNHLEEAEASLSKAIYQVKRDED